MKFPGLLIVLFFSCFCFGQMVEIPDANFKAFLVSHYDTSMDGEISEAEAKAVTGTMGCDNLGLSDLTGIAAFTNLVRLGCDGNKLTSLPDLSTLTKLEGLWCSSNKLTVLPDLSALTNLSYLYCHNNQLTVLPDLSALTKLEYLVCSHNRLRSLPSLATFTNLKKLYCESNQLIVLPDLSALTNLTSLYCWSNRIRSLPDLSALTNLKSLDCFDNQLTSLPDPSALTNLLYLQCETNQLTVLPDLSALTNLKSLQCYSNQLTVLPDLSALTNLKTLHCSYNQLTVLPELPTNLESLHCSFNLMTALPDLSALANLWHLDFRSNWLNAGDCPDIQATKALGINSFRFNPQQNISKLNCLSRGVHLTDQGGGFETGILIRNPETGHRRLTLLPYDGDGLELAPASVDLPAEATLRLPWDELFSAEAKSFIISDCDTCMVGVGYRATPDGSTAHVHQTAVTGNEFSFYPGEWDLLFDAAALINTGAEASQITAVMYNENGDPLAEVTLAENLQPGAKQLSLFNELFPNVADTLIKLTSTQPLAAMFLRFSKDSRFLYQNLPLPTWPAPGEERWLAHITREDAGFSTEVLLHNTDFRSRTVTLQPYNREGLALDSFEITLAGNGTRRFAKTEIFSSETSHASISGASRCLVSVGYRSQLPASSTATIHEAAPLGKRFFIYPGEWDLLFDGLALVNTGGEDAVIMLTQIDDDGQIRQSVVLHDGLAPNAKYLGLLEGLISPDPNTIIKVESTQPLAILALRLSKDLRYIYGNNPLP